jgi:hypothetical protein
VLTEMLVDKIIIERHPSKIDKDGRRNYLIRAIPYQDPEQEAERDESPANFGALHLSLRTPYTTRCLLGSVIHYQRWALWRLG